MVTFVDGPEPAIISAEPGYVELTFPERTRLNAWPASNLRLKAEWFGDVKAYKYLRTELFGFWDKKDWRDIEPVIKAAVEVAR